MKILDEANELQRTLRKQTLAYLGAGLGLVAGLAWNDAITTLINYIFPNIQKTVLAKLIYALILTLIVGTILTYLQKLSQPAVKKETSEPAKPN